MTTPNSKKKVTNAAASLFMPTERQVDLFSYAGVKLITKFNEIYN